MYRCIITSLVTVWLTGSPEEWLGASAGPGGGDLRGGSTLVGDSSSSPGLDSNRGLCVCVCVINGSGTLSVS